MHQPTDPHQPIVMEVDEIASMAWNLFEQAVAAVQNHETTQDPFAGLLALSAAALVYVECMGADPAQAALAIEAVHESLSLKMTELHKKYHGGGAHPGNDTTH